VIVPVPPSGICKPNKARSTGMRLKTFVRLVYARASAITWAEAYHEEIKAFLCLYLLTPMPNPLTETPTPLAHRYHGRVLTANYNSPTDSTAGHAFHAKYIHRCLDRTRHAQSTLTPAAPALGPGTLLTAPSNLLYLRKTMEHTCKFLGYIVAAGHLPRPGDHSGGSTSAPTLTNLL
jgi:hypothetical protein